MLSRLRRASAGLACLLVVLAGCTPPPPARPELADAGPPVTATWSVPSGPGPSWTPVGFDRIPGWKTDHPADALTAFLASCAQMGGSNQSLGGQGDAAAYGGTAAQWRGVCAAGQQVSPGDEAARAFFEARFQPFGVSTDGSAEGLYTGYYEPEFPGARAPTGTYKYPIYRRPPGLSAGKNRAPYFSRAEISHGALRGKRLELLWLADPIDAFFLEIQGSGRIRLPDGKIVRVTYDGQNGHQYVAIGRVLVDRGEMALPDVTMQSIRAWLDAHPDQAQEVMNKNPAFVFFREVPSLSADAGPPGAHGAQLTPRRSIAVDRSFVPLGAPVFIVTHDPVTGANFQQLMVAQDVGGAIRGAVRADIFWGWGPEAEERAGKMRRQGIEFLLLPKPDVTAAR
jgi:membrane-bound lytic murein transglycosylase A